MRKNKFKTKNGETLLKNRILSAKTDFSSVEAYKTLRTNIMFSLPKSDKAKIIAVSSANPGEGKTTTSINLAITFTQVGAKTLLVDCDMRKSRVHRYLNIEQKNGISNVLCGFSTIEEAIKKEVRPNLDVITGGEYSTNPSELLTSEKFTETLSELSEKYDYIILDTPPMLIVSDAFIAAKKASGMVLVSRRGVITYKMLDRVKASIEQSGIKVIGVIFIGNGEKKKNYKDEYRYIKEYTESGE